MPQITIDTRNGAVIIEGASEHQTTELQKLIALWTAQATKHERRRAAKETLARDLLGR